MLLLQQSFSSLLYHNWLHYRLLKAHLLVHSVLCGLSWVTTLCIYLHSVPGLGWPGYPYGWAQSVQGRWVCPDNVSVWKPVFTFFFFFAFALSEVGLSLSSLLEPPLCFHGSRSFILYKYYDLNNKTDQISQGSFYFSSAWQSSFKLLKLYFYRNFTDET